MLADEAWALLDLAPEHRQKRDVKKAYAKKLKSINQEEDPEAFIQLRTAYEMALYHLEINEAQSTSADLNTEPDLAPDEPVEDLSDIFDPLKIAYDLLTNEGPDERLGEWRELFERPELEEVDNYIGFERDLVTHLLIWRGYFIDPNSEEGKNFEPQVPPVPPSINNFIFEQFGWDNKTSLTYLNNQHALDWLVADSNRDPDISLTGTYSVLEAQAVQNQHNEEGNGWKFGSAIFIFIGFMGLVSNFTNNQTRSNIPSYEEILANNPSIRIVENPISLEKRIEISCAERESIFCDKALRDPDILRGLEPNDDPAFLIGADPLLVQEQRRVNSRALLDRVNKGRAIQREKLKELFPDVSTDVDSEFQLRNTLQPDPNAAGNYNLETLTTMEKPKPDDEN